MMKISSRIISKHRTPVYAGRDSIAALGLLLKSLRPSATYILTDTNTRLHCLPVLLGVEPSLAAATLLEVPAGEESKTIGTAEKLWHELLRSGANRSALLINLGGGVITDLGGFVAAGYQRGIRYINVPTSLLGQADAALGGKTAVNLGPLKNQVGFFYPAAAVFVEPLFLNTLPSGHTRSGLAEIVKSVLLSNGPLWRRLSRRPIAELLEMPPHHPFREQILRAAITFKNRVVVADFRESGIRKVLNFGHTIGHALESHALEHKAVPILHGDAVAAGMACACYLSFLKTGLSETDRDAIAKYLVNGFGVIAVDHAEKSRLFDLMMHDKKNRNGRINFTLLAGSGSPKINTSCDQDEISAAIDFYGSLSK